MRDDENPFGNMFGDIGKQMEGMQEQLKKAQENLLDVSVTGESGAGMVKITVNGNAGVQSVEIDDEVLKESKNVLQDLVGTAVTDAIRKLEAAKQNRFMSLLGDMQPPGANDGSVPTNRV